MNSHQRQIAIAAIPLFLNCVNAALLTLVVILTLCAGSFTLYICHPLVVLSGLLQIAFVAFGLRETARIMLHKPRFSIPFTGALLTIAAVGCHLTLRAVLLNSIYEHKKSADTTPIPQLSPDK